MEQRKYIGLTSVAELMRLAQSDISKKQDWVQFPTMPSPSDYIGKVVQYTGATDNDYTKGYFYYSNGLSWAQANVMSAIVTRKTSLPDWGLADPGLIYYVVATNKAYIRDNETTGNWFTITGSDSEPAFKIVNRLPFWTDADTNTIYLVKSSLSNTVTAYVKSGTVNTFYKLGGGGSDVSIALKKYPDSEHYDTAAVYPDTAETVEVDGLEVEAFTDQEIRALFTEA